MRVAPRFLAGSVRFSFYWRRPNGPFRGQRNQTRRSCAEAAFVCTPKRTQPVERMPFGDAEIARLPPRALFIPVRAPALVTGVTAVTRVTLFSKRAQNTRVSFTAALQLCCNSCNRCNCVECYDDFRLHWVTTRAPDVTARRLAVELERLLCPHPAKAHHAIADALGGCRAPPLRVDL